MKYTAYFLKFNSPLHIGDYKPDSYESSESFIRSDTINAAILASWASKGNADWIGDGNLPFTISSAFPYYMGESGPTLFFPRVRIPFPMTSYDASKSKLVKKISWMDQSYFEAIINAQDFPATAYEDIQNEFLTSVKLPEEGLLIKQVSERVKIPRERNDDNQSEPFYMERIYFNMGGLYFLATGNELNKLNAALDFLKYEGFGTDRNVGNGFFEWKDSTIDLNLPANAGHSTNLGLYCPNDKASVVAEIDEKSSYDLIKRGGWITEAGYQTIEKESIYMFSEGSVFNKSIDIDGKGNIDLSPRNLPQDLKPSHPIYRNGKTIFVPVNV